MSIRPLSHLSASIEGRILACASVSGKARLTSQMRFLILREEAAMKKLLIGLFIVIVCIIAGLLGSGRTELLRAVFARAAKKHGPA